LRITAFTPTGGSERTSGDQLCQPCRLAPPRFERAVAYGGYTGELRALIHALKYDGILPIAERLGVVLAEAILHLDAALFDCEEILLLPVPLHPSKRKERGFNHAELLARAAAKVLRAKRPNWRLKLAPGVLERQKVTRSQAGLSPNQRRANLRGVFIVPRPEQVKGRRVLLIDDIYTTGATARACSQVLRRAGAVSVHVATVARPQRENMTAPRFDAEELPMHEDVAFWGDRQEPLLPQSLIAGNS
jgi:ComF family protein